MQITRVGKADGVVAGEHLRRLFFNSAIVKYFRAENGTFATLRLILGSFGHSKLVHPKHDKERARANEKYLEKYLQPEQSSILETLTLRKLMVASTTLGGAMNHALTIEIILRRGNFIAAWKYLTAKLREQRKGSRTYEKDNKRVAIIEDISYEGRSKVGPVFWSLSRETRQRASVGESRQHVLRWRECQSYKSVSRRSRRQGRGQPAAGRTQLGDFLLSVFIHRRDHCQRILCLEEDRRPIVVKFASLAAAIFARVCSTRLPGI
ncbi:uncharacterized protein LOC143362061 [Halictus rubicundus]|uniref:uncharacterized protein LOC143362061 n=1 Tax=Halictus rubicundus TaxID=77578 RepID=UPI0040368C04